MLDDSCKAAKPARVAVRKYGPGLALVALATVVSMLVSNTLVVVSALVIAIAFGAVLRNVGVLPAAARPGLQWATKRFLRVGIVLLGLQLSLTQVLSLQIGELVTILATVVLTFLLTWWIGTKIGVGRTLSLLIATGFSICGASAVAAMGAVSGKEDRTEEDVATAIAMVTLFGSLSILLLPFAQGVVGFDDRQMGVWIGSSVHEVAQVVAAASIVSTSALTVAVVVKLSRVVMLAPLIAAIGAAERMRSMRQELAADTPEADPRPRLKRSPPLVPVFVLGFLIMAGIRSTGLLPAGVLDIGAFLTTALLTGAMFGLGTGVHVSTLVRTGQRAVVLSTISTLIAISVSLAGIIWLA